MHVHRGLGADDREKPREGRPEQLLEVLPPDEAERVLGPAPDPRVLDAGAQILGQRQVARALEGGPAQGELVGDVDVEPAPRREERLQVPGADKALVAARVQVKARVLAVLLNLLGRDPGLERPQVRQQLLAHPVDAEAARQVLEGNGVAGGAARRSRP